MNKYQLYCSCVECKLSTTVQNLSRHLNTHLAPTNLCTYCNGACKDKFCSKSCSAKYNNTQRSVETINKIKSTWEYKRFLKPKAAKVKKVRKPKLRTCISCGRIDETFGHFQSERCMFCNDSFTYRESCKFTFNIKQYPNEFNLTLISKFGMFNPVTNQQGVSKDHMLSVSYGKLNKIDPKIISHPANCKLMTQAENKAKQHYSSITLEELLERIIMWDAKYNDAGSGNAPLSVRLMRPSGST